MKARNPQPRQELTRQRLLNAAAEVFAEKGFHAATTREIVGRARVNIASLHYHFRDKRTLYLAVFRHFIDMTWALHPLPPELSEPLPAARRLGIFIESALQRLLREDRPDWAWQLATREMSDPTEAIDMIIERLVAPLLASLASIVRELLGQDVDDRAIRQCCISIMGQCAVYRFARPIAGHVVPQQRADDRALHELAEHITQFSLGAIAAIKSRGRKGAE